MLENGYIISLPPDSDLPMYKIGIYYSIYKPEILPWFDWFDFKKYIQKAKSKNLNLHIFFADKEYESRMNLPFYTDEEFEALKIELQKQKDELAREVAKAAVESACSVQ